jgi:hypothetical protein
MIFSPPALSKTEAGGVALMVVARTVMRSVVCAVCRFQDFSVFGSAAGPEDRPDREAIRRNVFED